MNILYCGDAGIRDGVLVSILSLLKNGEKRDIAAASDVDKKHNAAIADLNATKPELNVVKKKHKMSNNREGKNLNTGLPEYNIYIATIKYDKVKPFPEKAVSLLDGLVKQYNPKSFVKLIDVTEAFEKDLPSKNMKSYFTPCSMLRLYVDKMPEVCGLDRVLYLDYDVVCRRDIREFYGTNLDGIEAAGVLDMYGKFFFHYRGLFNADYMNSGVMLFNLPLCIKNGVFRQAVKYCVEKWSFFADQAALNKMINYRRLMPRRYNEQGERPQKDTVLHHFSNNLILWPYFRVQKVKPFEVEKVHKVLKINEYDDILETYVKLKKKL